jgi:low temperature requirement protein LtrA
VRPLRAALLDRPHLGERLGLFVIIVLGEAVAQLINGAAGVTDWDRRLALTSTAGFGLLVAIWWLTLRYGAGAAPTRQVALRFVVPAHYVLTGSIVALAAGLGALAAHGGHRVPEATRWVLCAGAALYFLTVTAIGVQGGAGRRWVLGWGVPAVLVPVLLGLFGGSLNAGAFPVILLAVALWHVSFRRRRTADPGPEGA